MLLNLAFVSQRRHMTRCEVEFNFFSQQSVATFLGLLSPFSMLYDLSGVTIPRDFWVSWIVVNSLSNLSQH